MSDKFKEIILNMPPRERQILQSAASAMNDDDTRPISLCRTYLPALSAKDAWSFLIWLRHQTSQNNNEITKSTDANARKS